VASARYRCRASRGRLGLGEKGALQRQPLEAGQALATVKGAELLETVCQRLRDGEGVPSRFFAIRNAYLFIGDYKYWLMTPPDQVDWDDEEVLNRAPLYRDRRDFVIQDGDSGMRIDYPSNPPH
jgi:hypothetical protein